MYKIKIVKFKTGFVIIFINKKTKIWDFFIKPKSNATTTSMIIVNVRLTNNEISRSITPCSAIIYFLCFFLILYRTIKEIADTTIIIAPTVTTSGLLQSRSLDTLHLLGLAGDQLPLLISMRSA